MYRVVALGNEGGNIVDRLRATGNYDDIRFVYCDTEKEQLMSHGNNNDKHILLTSLVQYNMAIHDDNELMAVLVTSLGDELHNKYVPDIIYELWGYADHTYCFATIPKLENATKNDGEYADLFNWITDHSETTVLQDNSLLPESLDRNVGIAQLLGLFLHHPRKGMSSERTELPFGILATEKQRYMALQAMYSNNPKMRPYYKAGTFSFHKSTHEY